MLAAVVPSVDGDVMLAAVVSPVDGESILVTVLVLLVALVHLLPEELPVPGEISRQALLSAAGGVSIVYAFLHLFPELDARRESLDGIDFVLGSLTPQHVYAVVFVGLALFYGLERLAAVARSRDVASLPDEPVFWVHVGGFTVYNAFIGYALVQGETGTEGTLLFAIAMGFHLLGNDEAMERHHPTLYRRFGRWALLTSVLAGAFVGAVYEIRASTFTILLGLLTGGIIFNAIKDELPRTQESRFWAFVVGSGVYALLVLSL